LPASPRGLHVTIDLRVWEAMRLGGERAVQLRVEAFNALNHVILGLRGQVLGAPALGVVSTAGPARTLRRSVVF
jgi:hypothetical protein